MGGHSALGRLSSMMALALVMVLAMLRPGPVAADVASVLLDVPWRTQIDGLPDQRDNAGLVCLGMVLSAYGMGTPTAVIRAQHDHLAGQSPSPVSPESLANTAVALGLVPQALDTASADPSAELRRQLGQGRPVALWLGPGEPPASQRWVVAIGYTSEDEIVYNDPGYPSPAYGQLRRLQPAEERKWLSQGALGIVLTRGEVPEPPLLPVPAGPILVGTPGDGAPEYTDAAPTAGGSDGPRVTDASPYWWRLIEDYAAWFGLDPYYVAAVVLAESGGDPDAVGDQGHSVGLMQLHDAGFGTGLWDLRYDPALNLWHGTKALAAGMSRFGDPYETYARYYNPGGEVAGERVMAWYRWLRDLGEQARNGDSANGAVSNTELTRGGQP